MSTQRPSLVIVGGGFTGAGVAIHLSNLAPGPLDIHVVEPRADLGRGLAYGTTDPAHRINVPAARMSVFARDEGHFERWLAATGAAGADPAAVLPDGRCFPRRDVFGRYMGDTLRRSLVARPDIAFTHHRTEAIHAAVRGRGYRVFLDDGACLDGDLLVVATSHPPPAPPPVLAALSGHPRYVADPWAEDALDPIRPDDRVLVVGTGLTMADIVASLGARGHRGPVTAVSRRGLLSRGHAPGGVTPFGDFARTPETGALRLLRRVRSEVAAAAAEGLPWQAVFDALRRDAQTLWAALPAPERRRLLRWLRPWWDVHRYRIAPQTEAAVEAAREAGRFTSLRGHLRAARSRGSVIALEIEHGDESRTLEADALIVATGPAHRGIAEASPFLASLADAGLIQADALDLGIAVDRESRAITTDGTARDTLFVAGPLARGTFGELMGIPQVSVHAEQVAARIANGLRVQMPQYAVQHFP